MEHKKDAKWKRIRKLKHKIKLSKVHKFGVVHKSTDNEGSGSSSVNSCPLDYDQDLWDPWDDQLDLNYMNIKLLERDVLSQWCNNNNSCDLDLDVDSPSRSNPPKRDKRDDKKCREMSINTDLNEVGLQDKEKDLLKPKSETEYLLEYLASTVDSSPSSLRRYKNLSYIDQQTHVTPNDFPSN